MTNMNNMGNVTYTRSGKDLKAIWTEFTYDAGTGTGTKTSGDKDGFEGEYDIIYHNYKEKDIGAFHLVIKLNKGFYDLAWFHKVDDKKGEQAFFGKGIAQSNMLSAWFKKCP